MHVFRVASKKKKKGRKEVSKEGRTEGQKGKKKSVSPI